MRALGTVVVVMSLCTSARADVAGDLADGSALATQGHFKDAIAKFKSAHAGDPQRSEPMCMIALAYRRLERWGQAKLFLAKCLSSDTKPEWADEASNDIETGIAHAGLSAVSFTITPAVDATITVSSFADDETFPAQTIFLEPGQQLITISAPGYKAHQIAVNIPAAPFEVKAVLVPDEPSKQPIAVHRETPEAPRETPVFTGKRVLIGSGVVLGAAIVVHVLASLQRSDLTKDDGATYTSQLGTFQTERAVALTAYGVAAVGTAIGLWLLHSESAAPQLSLVTHDRGASLAWSHAW